MQFTLITCIVCFYSGHVTDMYNAKFNSLEEKCLKRSVELNKLFYGQHKLPFIKFGGIIVAMTKSEVHVLMNIYLQLKQDSLPLTLRGNTDHGLHSYHVRPDLTRGWVIVGSPDKGTPTPPQIRPDLVRVPSPHHPPLLDRIRTGCTPPQAGPGKDAATSPPLNRVTNTCENIIFPRGR